MRLALTNNLIRDGLPNLEAIMNKNSYQSFLNILLKKTERFLKHRNYELLRKCL